MPGIRMVERGWLKVSKSDDAEQDLSLVRLLGQDLGAIVARDIMRLGQVVKDSGAKPE